MKIPKNDLEKKTVSNYSEIKKKKTNRNNSYTINEQYPTESKTPKTKRTPFRGVSSEETETLQSINNNLLRPTISFANKEKK